MPEPFVLKARVDTGITQSSELAMCVSSRVLCALSLLRRTLCSFRQHLRQPSPLCGVNVQAFVAETIDVVGIHACGGQLGHSFVHDWVVGPACAELVLCSSRFV
mmetsp:Transcript_30227/g.100084  ORF Transcript_30227/g.100084 Transcript_30227/m.100084 type:complete len:104 (+) Transcript_30227:2772-3083(+)